MNDRVGWRNWSSAFVYQELLNFLLYYSLNDYFSAFKIFPKSIINLNVSTSISDLLKDWYFKMIYDFFYQFYFLLSYLQFSKAFFYTIRYHIFLLYIFRYSPFTFGSKWILFLLFVNPITIFKLYVIYISYDQIIYRNIKLNICLFSKLMSKRFLILKKP